MSNGITNNPLSAMEMPQNEVDNLLQSTEPFIEANPDEISREFRLNLRNMSDQDICNMIENISRLAKLGNMTFAQNWIYRLPDIFQDINRRSSTIPTELQSSLFENIKIINTKVNELEFLLKEQLTAARRTRGILGLLLDGEPLSIVEPEV